MKEKDLEQEVDRIFKENLMSDTWEAWICKEALKLYLTAQSDEMKIKALKLIYDIAYHIVL